MQELLFDKTIFGFPIFQGTLDFTISQGMVGRSN